MSAFGGKAYIPSTDLDVRFWHKADMSGLFVHLGRDSAKPVRPRIMTLGRSTGLLSHRRLANDPPTP